MIWTAAAFPLSLFTRSLFTQPQFTQPANPLLDATGRLGFLNGNSESYVFATMLACLLKGRALLGWLSRGF